MRHHKLFGVCLAVCLVATSLAVCKTAARGKAEGARGLKEGWYNVAGNLVQFPETVASRAANTAITLGTDYQGIASTYNYLNNPDFEKGGHTANFTDNWRSNAWGGKKDFSGDSPGKNPPAHNCLVLEPQSGSGTEVMQRVQVEPDNWYYVSAWAYAEEEGSPLQMALSLYSQPGDAQGNAHARITTTDTIIAGQWKQTSFIIKIPPVDAHSGDNPFLDFRFRIDQGSIGLKYITSTEIFKLFPETVMAYTGVYGSLPGPISTPGWVMPVIDSKVTAEIIKEAAADVKDFSLFFFVWDVGAAETMPTAQDTFIIEKVKPYLRDGDVLAIVNGNGVSRGDENKFLEKPGSNTPIREVNMSIVNQRLEAFRRGLQGINIRYIVYTVGHEHVQKVIEGLSPASKSQVYAVMYGYEPDYQWEFQYDVNASLQHIKKASAMIRSAGLKAGTGPSGGGLGREQFVNWNYGRFAREVDIMNIQTQSQLRIDSLNKNLNITNYKNSVLNPLASQIMQGEYKTNVPVFLQITVGTAIGNETNAESSGNMADLIYCVKALEAIKEAGFAGATFWFHVSAMENMLKAVKTIRTARK